MPCVKNHISVGNDLQTVLLLSSAFLCFFSIFGLASSDTVTVLTLSHLVPFLPFSEVIPEIFCISVFTGIRAETTHSQPIENTICQKDNTGLKGEKNIRIVR